MADLSEIQVGGKLRLEVPITNVDRDSASEAVQVDIGHSFLWLSRRFVEAAEYIPPPKPAFKRGDWVRIADWEEGAPRHGLVVQATASAVVVSWGDDGDTYTYEPSDLEPDEAPNV